MQSVLLYGSEMWNLTRAVLAQLEGLHVRAAYKMAWKYKPRKGLFGKWSYPLTKDVLEEYGLHSVEEYIQTCWTTIAMYVVNRPLYLECKEGERQRGSMPRQWWWEQELGLDERVCCWIKTASRQEMGVPGCSGTFGPSDKMAPTDPLRHLIQGWDGVAGGWWSEYVDS